jgi:hypothetical protein
MRVDPQKGNAVVQCLLDLDPAAMEFVSLYVSASLIA